LKTSKTGQFLGAVAIAGVFATLAGGSPSSRVPTAAGVVEEVTPLPDGGRSYGLADGTSVVIASQKQVLLGGEPLVGELLLAGTDPDGRHWVAGLSRSSNGEPGCFWFTNNGRGSDGWIETYDGFRLPKAVGFDPAYIRDGNYQTPRGYFCLNELGEVTGYIPA